MSSTTRIYQLRQNDTIIRSGSLTNVWEFTKAHCGNMTGAVFNAQGYAIEPKGAKANG